MALRQCELCEKEFEPKKDYQRFCSGKCKKDWERGERRLIAQMKKMGFDYQKIDQGCSSVRRRKGK